MVAIPHKRVLLDRMHETYVSVDIEASGPIPGEYSMLSVGACVVGARQVDFYTELKPLNENFVPEALSVSGLFLEALREDGEEPAMAMARFELWVQHVTPRGQTPVFVAFNATFDWMFSHYYFMRFLGRDPFGVSGLDIKAFYMGMSGCNWESTSKRDIEARFVPRRPHTHHALDDAVWQAELFMNLLTFKQGSGLPAAE